MVFRLGESTILELRRAEIRPRWSYVGTKLAYVGPGLDLCWPMLDARWPMLAHVGTMLAYLGAMLGSNLAPRANPQIFLGLPGALKKFPLGPLVDPSWTPRRPLDTYTVYISGVGGKKRENLMVRFVCRLLGKVSLLDGARVPRFPSYKRTAGIQRISQTPP